MSVPFYPEYFTPQGWQCPVCKSVYAPSVPQCYLCASSRTPPVYSTGCPQCGKQTPGKCSSGSCPNYGTTC